MAPPNPLWNGHGREVFQIDPSQPGPLAKDVASGSKEALRVNLEEALRVEGKRSRSQGLAGFRGPRDRSRGRPGGCGRKAGPEENPESTLVPAPPALVAGTDCHLGQTPGTSQTASKALSLSEAANP